MLENTQHVELVASSFLDLISNQVRLNAAVRAFLFILIYSKSVVRVEVMHLSMLSPRVGGAGYPREID